MNLTYIFFVRNRGPEGVKTRLCRGKISFAIGVPKGLRHAHGGEGQRTKQDWPMVSDAPINVFSTDGGGVPQTHYCTHHELSRLVSWGISRASRFTHDMWSNVRHAPIMNHDGTRRKKAMTTTAPYMHHNTTGSNRSANTRKKWSTVFFKQKPLQPNHISWTERASMDTAAGKVSVR